MSSSSTSHLACWAHWPVVILPYDAAPSFAAFIDPRLALVFFSPLRWMITTKEFDLPR